MGAGTPPQETAGTAAGQAAPVEPWRAAWTAFRDASGFDTSADRAPDDELDAQWIAAWKAAAQAAIDAATEGTIRALGFTLADIGRFIEAEVAAPKPQTTPGDQLLDWAARIIATATEEADRLSTPWCTEQQDWLSAYKATPREQPAPEQPAPDLEAAFANGMRVRTAPCTADAHDGEHFQVRTNGHWLCGHLLASMLAAQGIFAQHPEQPAPELAHAAEQQQLHEESLQLTITSLQDERDRLRTERDQARHLLTWAAELIRTGRPSPGIDGWTEGADSWTAEHARLTAPAAVETVELPSQLSQ
jgi:DNA-binding transcriptional MerR regulator